MKVYRVKLNDNHSVHPDQIIDGYLGNNFGNGKIALYTLGSARKKAHLFGGKSELFKEFTNQVLGIIQLAKEEINPIILKEIMDKHICYIDRLQDEFMSFGDVFHTIIEENKNLPKEDQYLQEVIDELDALDTISQPYEYIQFV